MSDNPLANPCWYELSRIRELEAELSRMRIDLIGHETCVCGWTMYHASADDCRRRATAKVDTKYPIAAALKGGAE